MLYDCFLFFNELDLLDLRLEELGPLVDKFVLVEADKTFSGKMKELCFVNNRHRYAKYLDKIINISVEDMPVDKNRWKVERYQRNSILRGLSACHPEDIIMVSDIDEIPHPEAVQALRDFKKDKFIASFKQRLFCYYLNGSIGTVWQGTAATRRKFLKFPQDLRDVGTRKFLRKTVINNGGWHFSYLGLAETIAYKMHSFAHAEFDRPNIRR